MDTMTPMGPWIRSTQYGRRKQEIKDQKFYSNLSHSPDFGKYSPPVPASLIAQLAAMKIQTKGNTVNNNDNNPSQGNTSHRAGNQGNGDQNHKQDGDMIVEYQQDNSNEKMEMDKINQAKRLKRSTTGNTNIKQQMAGLGMQASQLP
jgi:hypothetical protein